jgi:hypothetical integral membrane protein (TIGR02206 family)
MFKYFFTYADYLPHDAGFKMFGTGHIVWLILTICAAVLLSLKYRSLQENGRKKLGLVVCWIIFISEIGKDVYLLLIIGVFNLEEVLPLHLCGMAIYISLINAYRPGKITQEMLYSLCMPGALAALIFPSWTFYPMISIVSMQNFIQHALLLIYPVMLLSGGDIKPNHRNLPKCFLFLVIVSAPIYVFNKIFDTDFLFINYPAKGSPLVLFEKWFGNPGYILGILMLIIIIWMILYLPIMLKHKSRKADCQIRR